MKIKHWQILLLIMLLSGCGEKKNTDKTTKLFSDFLEKNFNASIPDSLHYYILIPQIFCESCVVSGLAELQQNLQVQQAKKITFITDNKQIIPDFAYPITNFEDKNNALDKINLPIANVTLIETKNGEVIFLKSFNSNEKVSLLGLMKN